MVEWTVDGLWKALPFARYVTAEAAHGLLCELDLEWSERARRAVALVNPGPAPVGVRTNVAMNHFYDSRLSLYNGVRSALFDERAGMIEGEAAPVVPAGWSRPARVEKAWYLGIFCVEVHCLLDSRFAVYIDGAYHDGYDDVDEAWGAARAYVESLWTR